MNIQLRFINQCTPWWDLFGTLPLQFITEAFGSTPLQNFISFNYSWHSSSQAHWVPALLLAICLSLISLTLVFCSLSSSEISVAHSSHTERRCGGNDLCSVLHTSIIYQMDKSRWFSIITSFYIWNIEALSATQKTTQAYTKCKQYSVGQEQELCENINTVCSTEWEKYY